MIPISKGAAMSLISNDPKLFDPGAIDMETSAFNEKIEKELSRLKQNQADDPENRAFKEKIDELEKCKNEVLAALVIPNWLYQ